MRVCWDLPAGFMGIGLEKSVDVAVHDSTPPLRPKSHKASNIIGRQFCGFLLWSGGKMDKKGVVIGVVQCFRTPFLHHALRS